MDTIVILVAYIAGMSVATERCIETLKVLGLRTFIEGTKTNSDVYKVIAVGVGAALAFVAPMPIDIGIPKTEFSALVGLAVSGGSGFWNTILEKMRGEK